MNIVYFVWSSKQGHHQNLNVTAKELCVSILSVRKHMSGSEIFVYTSNRDRDVFSDMLPFFEKENIHMVYVDRHDLHDSYFNKILWFRKAIDDLTSFLFMDTDATFIKKMPEFSNVPLKFSRFIKGRSKPFTKVQMEFIKKYFKIKQNYTYFRSTVVWVDQATASFPWAGLRTEMDDVIDKFSAVEKNVRHIGKNRKQFYMDELYFSMIIYRLGLKVRDFATPNLKDYNQYILPDWGLGVKNKEFKSMYLTASTSPDTARFFR